MSLDDLQPRTRVRLTLLQTVAVLAAILGCTWRMRGQLDEQLRQSELHTLQLTALSQQVELLRKEQVADSEASRIRLAEWWQWRWGVTQDVKTLSANVRVKTITK